MAASERIKQIFGEAFEKSVRERGVFLDAACSGDAQLRAEVDALLVAFDSAEEFLVSKSDQSGPSCSTAEAPREESQSLEGPGAVIGRYKLLQEIGHGGFGTVFMAEQREPIVRKVALKVIKLGMDTRQVIGRFQAERQALAMMDHPNIAKVLDAGATDTGRPYFVMELVKGTPLTKFCDANRLPTRERLTLFTDVCHAVQHAHQKGVIHRDLKPSNVLVSRHDEKPVVKIIDFGIAKAIGGKLAEQTLFTDFHALIGTPAYMSPEQAGMSDLDIDTRSDVYSLGVLLYELLTGTTPFDERTLRRAAQEEIRRFIREVEPPKPSTRLSVLGSVPRVSTSGPPPSSESGGPLPGHGSDIATIARERGTDPRSLVRLLRGDLDWIVMKCLEKDRARRYETASGLAMDVQRHLAGEPTIAAPPSRSYRLQKLIRRNRTLVGASAAVMLALAAGLGASLWQAIRARDEAAKAIAISGFLQRTLSTADPLHQVLDPTMRSTGIGSIARERKVVDVVNQADQGLDAGEFSDQPLTEAALRFSLGRVYFGLGQLPQAERNLRRAYELQKVLLGPEDPETLVTLTELVHSAQGAADFTSLMALALEAVPRVLGSEHRATLSLLLPQADGLHGEFAVERLRDVLAAQQRVLPEGDPDTLITMHHLGSALVNMDRWPEAQKLAQETIELAIREYGEDGLYTHCARKLMVNSVRRGPNGLELGMIETAIDGFRRHLGDDHILTLDSRRVRADILIDLARYEDAEMALRALLVDWTRLRGNNNDASWGAHLLLARVFWRTGRLEEAEDYAKECLRNVPASAYQDMPLTTTGFLEVLYEVHKEQGRLPEALAVAREALAVLSDQHHLGRYESWAIDCRDDIIYVLSALGQLQEAETLAREQLDILRRTRGPTHPRTLRALNGLAWALFESGRFAEAEPLAAEAVAGFRSAESFDVLDRINTTDTLAVTLCNLGRPAEAEPLFREIFELFALGPPPRFFPGDAGLHALHYGECLLMLARYPDADARLLEALNAAGQAPGEEAKRTAQTARERLVELYEAQKLPEKAAEFRGMIDVGQRP